MGKFLSAITDALINHSNACEQDIQYFMSNNDERNLEITSPTHTIIKGTINVNGNLTFWLKFPVRDQRHRIFVA